MKRSILIIKKKLIRLKFESRLIFLNNNLYQIIFKNIIMYLFLEFLLTINSQLFKKLKTYI